MTGDSPFFIKPGLNTLSFLPRCPPRRQSAKFLDFPGGFVYYVGLAALQAFILSQEDDTVIKVNQEELKQKIETLKKSAAEKAAKAGGKKSDPEARSAKKQVKRAQRKLRAVKAYKLASKKAAEAKAGEAKATA